MSESRVDTGDIPATGEPEAAGDDAAAALAAKLKAGGWTFQMHMRLQAGSVLQYRSDVDGRVSYVKTRRKSAVSEAWYFAAAVEPFPTLQALAAAVIAHDAPPEAGDGAPASGKGEKQEARSAGGATGRAK